MNLAMNAPMVDGLSKLLFVVAMAVTSVIAMRRWPHLGVVAWLGTIALIPPWMGMSNLGPFLPPPTITALLVLVSLVPLTVPILGTADLLMAAFFSACLLPFALGALRLPALFAAVGIWGLAYLLGRLLPARVGIEWIHSAIAIAMGLVAVGAMAEFLLTFNPFGMLTSSNETYAAWAPLQERGGVLRAEGAFGHSIALGSSLALAIPFAVACRLRMPIRVLLVLALVGGVTVSFSRSAMMSAAVALVLSIFTLRNGLSQRVRVGFLISGIIAVIALQPLVSRVFTEASTETATSSAYRGDLLSLVEKIALVGTSGVGSVSASGRSLFGQFDSIDSAVLLLGLTYGLVAMVLAGVLYLAAGWKVISRQGGPAVVAIVAQLPTLLTVALITQYASMVWFVAGLAVYSVCAKSSQVVVGGYGSDSGSLEAHNARNLVMTGSPSAGSMRINGGGRSWASTNL